MEEILASIRRIIADDNAVPPPPMPEPLAPVSLPEIAPEPPVSAQAPVESVPVYETERVEGWTDIPAQKAASAEPAPALRSSFDFVPGREYRPLSARPPVAERPAFSRDAAPRAAAELPVERRENPRRLAPGPRSAPPSPVAPLAAEEALVSPATDAMVSQAFNTLIASRFLQSNDVLGEMVRDMLKPMLKAWLDDNLPILVERLVRTEIERVARGGR